MRLIDADEVDKIINAEIARTKSYSEHETQINIKFAVKELPTIEAVPVVHGRWIEDTHGNIICSKCKSMAKGDMSGIFRDRDFRQHKTPFCPNCGADMRKGGK